MKSCVLFTYYEKKKRKERSIRNSNPLKLIKGFKVYIGEIKASKQVSSSSIQLRYFSVLFTPINKAKQ